MANSGLANAKNAKNDEFYTQYYDIEKEMNAYLLTLTMRHPSWIFLFFGGRIVTFAPV
nr:adenine-specific methyltransferase EcoRI family protein [Segatella copri]